MPGCSPHSFVTLTILLVAVSSAAHASSNAQLIATPLVASTVDQWRLALAPVTLTGAIADRLQDSHIQLRAPERPRLLVPLYISFAGLQALDAHSTIKALDHGYVEANPLVAASTRNRAAFVAMKVAVTASVIVGAERLWPRHRVAAVVAILAVNGAYAAIVAHNYRNASR
jgi:hypothetical protein